MSAPKPAGCLATGFAFVAGFVGFEAGMFGLMILNNRIDWPGWTGWAALLLVVAIAAGAIVVSRRAFARDDKVLANAMIGVLIGAVLYGGCLVLLVTPHFPVPRR